MMTGIALEFRHGPGGTIPIAARSSVNAYLPIAVGRAVATGTEQGHLLPIEQAPVLGLEFVQVLGVVAVVAIVVAVITTVRHHQVIVFFGQRDVIVGADVELRARLFLVVTGIAIEPGGIGVAL